VRRVRQLRQQQLLLVGQQLLRQRFVVRFFVGQRFVVRLLVRRRLRWRWRRLMAVRKAARLVTTWPRAARTSGRGL
jgi:hypothetical protein